MIRWGHRIKDSMLMRESREALTVSPAPPSGLLLTFRILGLSQQHRVDGRRREDTDRLGL